MAALPLIVFDVNETLSIFKQRSHPFSVFSVTRVPRACGLPYIQLPLPWPAATSRAGCSKSRSVF